MLQAYRPDRIQKEKLRQEIDLLRSQLILTGCREGLNSRSTLEISQKLDMLLFQYQALQKQFGKGWVSDWE